MKFHVYKQWSSHMYTKLFYTGHFVTGASCGEGESYSWDDADDGSEALGTMEYMVPQAVPLSLPPSHCYLHIVEGIKF